MNASSFIAGGLSFRSRAATVSIAVSFIVMIAAIAIADGFELELGREFASVCGDIAVKPAGPHRIKNPDKVISSISGIEGIESLRPVIYDMAVTRNGDNIQGVVFKAVPDGPDSACVVIPRPLAARLSLSVGDRLICYFPGERLIARKFTVGDVYEPIVADEDKMTVLCSLSTLAAMRNDEDEGSVSAIEIILKDSYRGDRKSFDCKEEIAWKLSTLSSEIGENLYAIRKQEEYAQIFSWLRLIRNNVSFILILMTIVAAINMTGCLLILLFENTRTIGLLKALGMNDRDISRTFLKLSSRLVGKAMCVGNFIGVGLMLVQKYTSIVKLDKANYFLSHVPVSLDWSFILTCDIVAFILIMAVLIFPCRFISSVEPSRTLTME